MGSAGHSCSLNRLRAEERSSGRTSELFCGRVREGDGYFVPFLHSYGEAGGAPDDRRRDDVRYELLRREQGGRELQCDGRGQKLFEHSFYGSLLGADVRIAENRKDLLATRSAKTRGQDRELKSE